MDVKIERLLKIVLVGDERVGKTQIWDRFLNGAFSSAYTPTTGATFSGTRMLNGSVILHVWDIPGTEMFEGLSTPFYHAANAMGIVIDITLSQTEQEKSMRKWIEDIKLHKRDGAILYFIGNKSDINSETNVNTEAFTAAAAVVNTEQKQKNGNSDNYKNIPIFFCSAKSGVGIERVFEAMTEDCINALGLAPSPPKNTSLLAGPIPLVPTPFSTTPSSSKNPSLWEKIKQTISENPVLVGVDAFIIVALITLLIIATLPVGGILALGPLSALVVVGIIGGGALLLWNVGYAIFKGFRGGGGDLPTGPPPASLQDPPSSNPTVAKRNDPSYSHVYGKREEPNKTEVPPPVTNTNQPPATKPKLGSGPGEEA